jgi:acetyl esterase/lipase
MRPICILLFAAWLVLGSCSLKRVVVHKNIPYSTSHPVRLDVYAPRKCDKSCPVMLFVHGGNWCRGHKNTYRFLGKGFARKHVVTVIIDYRLANETDYQGMTQDVADAITWTQSHISSYGGDSTRLFVSGHSAGAHLAALAILDRRYLNQTVACESVRGAIMLDGFGLNMADYLRQSHDKKDSIYTPTFSRDTITWQKASPINDIHEGMPPFIFFTGGKTYPVITWGTREFMLRLKPFQPGAKHITVKHKRHVGMITLFFNPRQRVYSEILGFMDAAPATLPVQTASRP